MGATANIDAIKGYLKTNGSKLLYQRLNELSIFKDFKEGVIRNHRSEVVLTKMVPDAGVRQLNTSINSPKGGRTYTGRTIVPRFGMKILGFNPDELLETFLGAMMAPGQKREPFHVWSMEREFEKMKAEIENAFYTSKYVPQSQTFEAGATYSIGDVVYFETDQIFYECVSATTAGQSPASHPAKWSDADEKVLFDGLATIITELITGGLTPTTTGAWDHTNAVEKVMTMWDNVPEAWRNTPGGLRLHVSLDGTEDYTRNYNSIFGHGAGIGGVDLDTIKPFKVRDTAGRLTLVPTQSMGSSRRMIITAPGNVVIGTNTLPDFNSVGKVIETHHGYESVIKFALNSQIADPEALWVNDQA
jgi:hypothetical protein